MRKQALQFTNALQFGKGTKHFTSVIRFNSLTNSWISILGSSKLLMTWHPRSSLFLLLLPPAPPSRPLSPDLTSINQDLRHSRYVIAYTRRCFYAHILHTRLNAHSFHIHPPTQEASKLPAITPPHEGNATEVFIILEPPQSCQVEFESGVWTLKHSNWNGLIHCTPTNFALHSTSWTVDDEGTRICNNH